mgnify:CR=1 FL=1
MPNRVTDEGKVFQDLPGLGQSNNPSDNPRWGKIGSGQRASQQKMREYQFKQRAKQRGAK